MIITAAGPVHGNILTFYRGVAGDTPKPDWVLCTGSFGVWPDKNRVDKATNRFGGAGDFPELYLKNWDVPIRTLFVRGPHEDQRWLSERQKLRQLDVLPNLTLLMTGFRTVIDEDVRVVGVGGIYSPKYFDSRYSGKYYTKRNIKMACQGGGTDILLTHAGPDNPGIKTLIHQTRPKLFIHYTFLTSRVYEVLGVTTVSLGKGETKSIEYKNDKFYL